MRLLTAVSLVRVQQGEPKAKHRFTRCFVFVFREDVGQRRCGAAASRLLTGSEPSAACGRYSEAENGQGQRALQAPARAMRPCPNLRSLVRVQSHPPYFITPLSVFFCFFPCPEFRNFAKIQSEMKKILIFLSHLWMETSSMTNLL